MTSNLIAYFLRLPVSSNSGKGVTLDSTEVLTHTHLEDKRIVSKF